NWGKWLSISSLIRADLKAPFSYTENCANGPAPFSFCQFFAVISAWANDVINTVFPAREKPVTPIDIFFVAESAKVFFSAFIIIMPSLLLLIKTIKLTNFHTETQNR